jgi:hypothetical protein
MSDVAPRTRPTLARHALWVLALAAGCAQEPSDVVEEVDQSVKSWSSCVRLAAGQRAAHRVPDVYVKQLLEAAGEALDEQAASLSDVPPADSRRQALQRRINEVRGALDELSGAPGPRDGGGGAG